MMQLMQKSVRSQQGSGNTTIGFTIMKVIHCSSYMYVYVRYCFKFSPFTFDQTVVYSNVKENCCQTHYNYLKKILLQSMI